MNSLSNYSMVPTERLEALRQFRLNELCKSYASFRKRWRISQKCKCIHQLSKKSILNCRHVAKALHEKFKKEREGSWNLTVEIIKRSFPESKLSHKWFENLKL